MIKLQPIYGQTVNPGRRQLKTVFVEGEVLDFAKRPRCCVDFSKRVLIQCEASELWESPLLNAKDPEIVLIQNKRIQRVLFLQPLRNRVEGIMRQIEPLQIERRKPVRNGLQSMIGEMELFQ